MNDIETSLPVGIISNESAYGGIYIIAKKIASFVKGKMILISLSSKGNLSNTNDLELEVFKFLNKRLFIKINSVIKTSKQVSLFHIHYINPGLFTLFLFSRKPKIITFHYIFKDAPFLSNPKNLFNRLINSLLLIPISIFYLNFCLIFSKKITFLTEAQRNDFKKRILFKKLFQTKSIVIKNFIEKENILVKKQTFNKKVLFIGRYTKIKGFEDLIKLTLKLQNVEFSLIGNDEYKPETFNVINIGRINNQEVFKYLDKHTIFVLPSYSEVFPMVILEAMARGLVVIASDILGMKEIIKDGINGYLFPVGDIKRMEEIINYLLNNPKEIERISRNNLKDIWNFTPEKQIIEYKNIYNSILKKANQ